VIARYSLHCIQEIQAIARYSLPCMSHLQVMAEKFLRVAGQYNWAGVSCFVSTLLITIATFMLRFLSLPPSDAYV